jgi:hypothetical protein
MSDHKKDAGRTLQLDDSASMAERDTWWRKGKVLNGKVTNMQRAGLDRAILLEAMNWLVASGHIDPVTRECAFKMGTHHLGRTEPLYSKATPIDFEPHLSSATLDRAEDL